MSQKSWMNGASSVTVMMGALALGFCSLAASADLREVTVDLRFEAKDYKALPAKVKQAVKDDLEPRLCEILVFRYPFLHWSPSKTAPGKNVVFAPALYDDDVSGVALQYEAYVPERLDGPIKRGSQVMSRGGARPQDATNILKKVRDPLLDDVRTAEFLFADFIRHIRVAPTVVPVGDVIVVPVEFNGMNADRGTRLNALVHGQLPRRKREGSLGLTPIRKSQLPNHAGETEADVKDCDGVSDAPGRASKDLARLMKAKRIDEIYVTVGEYQRQPRTDGYGNMRKRS